MLRLLGSKRKLCDGFTRRDWLRVGGLGFLGLSLEDALRLQARSAEPAAGSKTFGRAKACILLLPYGSPSQFETFDPKPDAPAEIRGQFGSIPTSLAGVRFGEHLPRTAAIADRLTIVRSMTHPYPVHSLAYVVSGIPDYSPALETRPQDQKLWPYIGSVVDYISRKSSGDRPTPTPQNIALPWKMNSRGGPQAALVETGPYAAFLGPAYDPVLTEFVGQANRTIAKIDREGERHDILDPYSGVEAGCRFRIAGCELPAELTLDRFARRRSLLVEFDAARRAVDSAPATRTFDRYRQMAYAAIASPRLAKALDVRLEPPALRDDYGLTLFGQSCLAARRLVEADGKFVTVFWDEFAYQNTDWDTHWEHFPRLEQRLLPGFDRAFSALVRDLDSRGLLDETLVVWMSEHGRTPRIASVTGGGRDHWSRAYSIVMAGGGVGRGKVVGASDRIGSDVVSTPVSPKDILATILHLLGIDPHQMIPDRQNRPLPIAGTGVVRPELFG